MIANRLRKEAEGHWNEGKIAGVWESNLPAFMGECADEIEDLSRQIAIRDSILSSRDHDIKLLSSALNSLRADREVIVAICQNWDDDHLAAYDALAAIESVIDKAKLAGTEGV